MYCGYCEIELLFCCFRCITNFDWSQCYFGELGFFGADGATSTCITDCATIMWPPPQLLIFSVSIRTSAWIALTIVFNSWKLVIVQCSRLLSQEVTKWKHCCAELSRHWWLAAQPIAPAVSHIADQDEHTQHNLEAVCWGADKLPHGLETHGPNTCHLG